MSLPFDSPSSDDELTIPRAAMNKMIKEILPHLRVGLEARELILSCCTEFIQLIASEANEICSKKQKKTINPEHILLALDALGFEDYRADVEAVLEDCKAVASKSRRKSNRLEDLGIPEEELFRQQQELFEQAREEQRILEQQQWQQIQEKAAEEQRKLLESQPVNEDEDYS